MENLNFGFYLACFYGGMWFTILNFLNYYKNKNIYAEVLKNQKQSNEMRKILQTFPKSVLISSADDKKSYRFFIN